jgi:hypothetical protein
MSRALRQETARDDWLAATVLSAPLPMVLTCTSVRQDNSGLILILGAAPKTRARSPKFLNDSLG